jgi:hypothetical protein
VKVVALKQLWFLKEQSQKLARKNIKGECYLRVTLVDTGLRQIFRKWDVGVWTGLSWLRIETGGGHL